MDGQSTPGAFSVLGLEGRVAQKESSFPAEEPACHTLNRKATWNDHDFSSRSVLISRVKCEDCTRCEILHYSQGSSRRTSIPETWAMGVNGSAEFKSLFVWTHWGGKMLTVLVQLWGGLGQRFPVLQSHQNPGIRKSCANLLNHVAVNTYPGAHPLELVHETRKHARIIGTGCSAETSGRRAGRST